MDDAWFHSATTQYTESRQKQYHQRRASLLEQQAELRHEATIDPIHETSEAPGVCLWQLPAVEASKRAQSYSDFYDIVKSFEKSGQKPRRRRSLESLPRAQSHRQEPTLAFEEEFAKAESSLLEQSQRKYSVHHSQLQLSCSYLEHILKSARQTLANLSELNEAFKSVEEQTIKSRHQCENLVEEQRRLERLANSVSENARYYHYLEPITRRLNSPNAGNLVRGRDFPEMLSNLDQCLAYMEAHPEQKESGPYRSRYRLLLTRALTLIRHHITKGLGDIAADVGKRISNGHLLDTAHAALLYARFRVPAPELKALGLEIQKRAIQTPEDIAASREPEYSSLMNEIYQSYASTRSRLIQPLISRKMAELQLANSQQQSDILSISQASISYLRGICLDEYELWYEWFETTGPLYEFLESLMDPMYDYLRPRIIHETKLEKLCDLCAMMQSRYMNFDSDNDEHEDQENSDKITNGKASKEPLNFGLLVHPVLEDAQTRLVFLAMNVLRDSIENYKPKPQDLEWPKKNSGQGTKKGIVMSGRRSTLPNTSKPADEFDDEDAGLDHNGRGKFTQTQFLYPTLRKAIWLLRRIYRLVNSTVFDDLAHRIVHSTIQSLLNGSQHVSRSSGKTVQDGQLFLITNLLHLKQQIVAFDIEFIPPEVEFDFSSITNTFYELRDRGSLWNPGSWVRLVGGAVGGGLLPKVVKNMLDAKAELDGRLRTVINDFVNSYSQHIMGPIQPSHLAGMHAKDKDANPFDAAKAIRTIRGLAEKDVPVLRSKLAECISDARTRETLVAAVRDEVVLTYEEFFDSQYKGTGKKFSRKGKGRENEVWDPETFNEAIERIFQVSQIVGNDSDNDGASSDQGSV